MIYRKWSDIPNNNAGGPSTDVSPMLGNRQTQIGITPNYRHRTAPTHQIRDDTCQYGKGTTHFGNYNTKHPQCMPATGMDQR